MEVVKLCECGCGEAAPIAKKTRRERGQVKGQPLRFVHGHYATQEHVRTVLSATRTGGALTVEHRAKIRAAVPLGAASKVWKGDGAGYAAIHRWLHRHKPRTGECEHCGARPFNARCSTGTQFANLSGEYRRDVDDYLELCPSCHKILDLVRERPAITLSLFEFWTSLQS